MTEQERAIVEAAIACVKTWREHRRVVGFRHITEAEAAIDRAEIGLIVTVDAYRAANVRHDDGPNASQAR